MVQVVGPLQGSISCTLVLVFRIDLHRVQIVGPLHSVAHHCSLVRICLMLQFVANTYIYIADQIARMGQIGQLQIVLMGFNLARMVGFVWVRMGFNFFCQLVFVFRIDLRMVNIR